MYLYTPKVGSGLKKKLRLSSGPYKIVWTLWPASQEVKRIDNHWEKEKNSPHKQNMEYIDTKIFLILGEKQAKQIKMNTEESSSEEEENKDQMRNPRK